jgi:O-antigen/teichoic acid export membrane protein
VDGRSLERYRRVALSGLATGVARGVTMLTVLVAVPLMLGHLGRERYGLWATLSSIMALISFADVGLGSGLMNVIATAQGKNDSAAAARSVSSAFYTLCAIALVVVLAFSGAFRFVPWPQVFNVSSPAAVREAGPATAILVLCFALSMPLGIVQRIHAGYQEAFVASAWQALGSVLGLAGVVAAVLSHAGLPWLVLSLAGCPVVAMAANSVWLFRSRRPWLSPRLSLVSARASVSLLRTGFLFFVLQISAAVSYQSASLIIAHVMTPSDVPRYTVPMTLFQLSPWLLGLVLTPLWPAYAESMASGDVGWIRKSFRRSIRWSLTLNVPAAVLLMIVGERIVRVWVGGDIQPQAGLLVSMGVWTILNSLNGPFAMLLNGLEAIRFQVVCATLMAGTNVLLGIFLTRRLGVTGVVAATVVAQFVFILIPSAIYVPRLLAGLSGQDAVAS